jgi:hypothetical protein
MTTQTGPIYGVPLLSVLPLDDGTMKQALPSRQDLEDVLATHINGDDRVVAGFEVLTEHYRRAKELADILIGGVRDLQRHCKVAIEEDPTRIPPGVLAVIGGMHKAIEEATR